MAYKTASKAVRFQSKGKLSPASKLVYIVLCEYANLTTGLAWPSVKLICKNSELSETGVRLALKKLIEVGLILQSGQVRGLYGHVNRYYIPELTHVDAGDEEGQEQAEGEIHEPPLAVCKDEFDAVSACDTPPPSVDTPPPYSDTPHKLSDTPPTLSAAEKVSKTVNKTVSKNKFSDENLYTSDSESQNSAKQQKDENSEQEKPKPAKSKSKEVGAGLNFSSWPERASPQVLQDWFAMRKAKRAPVSQTVVNRFGEQLRKAAEVGISVDECLAECITRGWQGFMADWLIAQKAREALGINPQTGRPFTQIERINYESDKLQRQYREEEDKKREKQVNGDEQQPLPPEKTYNFGGGPNESKNAQKPSSAETIIEGEYSREN